MSTEAGVGKMLQATSPIEFATFPTEFGWFCLAGEEGDVRFLTIGHASASRALSALRSKVSAAGVQADRLQEEDWDPLLRQRLEDFAIGGDVDFRDVALHLPRLTSFQTKVLRATRRIPFGETRTYGEVAKQVGSDRAARAVGSVMAANRFPIIVPCHRVVGAGGKLTGFSAPTGVSLKERMLAMEARVAASGALESA